jgi:hypothetical protein
VLLVRGSFSKAESRLSMSLKLEIDSLLDLL